MLDKWLILSHHCIAAIYLYSCFYCSDVNHFSMLLLGKPWGYKTFSMRNSAEQQKNILLINATIVGILTFISMINKKPERLKAINFFICRYLSVYEQFELSCSVELSMKSFL